MPTEFDSNYRHRDSVEKQPGLMAPFPEHGRDEPALHADDSTGFTTEIEGKWFACWALRSNNFPFAIYVAFTPDQADEMADAFKHMAEDARTRNKGS